MVDGLVAAVFKAAMRDRLLNHSPCDSTKLPRTTPHEVMPLTTATVRALTASVPPRYRALLTLAAGTGLRQGEALGLTVDRVHWLRRTLTVDRQLITLVGKAPGFGPPKTDASYRTIPLPDVVLEALTEHLATYPAGPDGLLFRTERGEPVRRTSFSANVWRPAVKDVGVPDVVFHELRHYYASALIRQGASPKQVQKRLGHATAAETMDTYTHLWPDDEDLTRAAIDRALGGASEGDGELGRTVDGL